MDGRQLLWQGDIGDEVSVMFEVGQQYEGPMTARFTLAPDYGIFNTGLWGGLPTALLRSSKSRRHKRYNEYDTGPIHYCDSRLFPGSEWLVQ